MHLETLTSAHNPRVKRAIRLQASRGRKQQGRIVIHGQREIERAIAQGLLVEEVFVGLDQPASWIPASNRSGDPIQGFRVSPEIQGRLQYGQREAAAVAVAQRPSTSLQQFPVADPDAVVVVLEAVEKPGNLGAIARSLDAAGASGLMLADPLTDPFHPNAIRSSTGALFGMPIATGSAADIRQWLLARGFEILSASLEGAEDFYDCRLLGAVALVLGNEAQGLTAGWHQPPCRPVKLPMRGHADSLNVSVTASVMLYEALRQRRVAGSP